MLTGPKQLLEAFDARKATFLALRDWQVTPFLQHAPSAMHDLLSYATQIPSLLEDTDLLAGRCHQERSAAGQRLYHSFREALAGLEGWERSFKHNASKIQCWILPAHRPSSEPHDLRQCTYSARERVLCFSDISTANALTHIWAFQIVCLVQINSLTSCFEDPTDHVQHCARDYEKNVVDLSTRICQSMGYLMQDEMNLYGPASTLFPLRTAFKALKPHVPRSSELVDWCQEIMECLRAKGLAFAACYFNSA